MSRSIFLRSGPIRAALGTCQILRQSIPAQRAHVVAPFHTSHRRAFPPQSRSNDEGGEHKPASFSDFDVFANMPPPATSVDACTDDGFHLNSGARIDGGDGVLLVSGEAFRWRPWVAKRSKQLVNSKGQWEVPGEVFGALGLVWPRPDLLILGVGPEIRPISPETRSHIANLGMRVEVLDTRNAASQFNLLATERGVEDVAAALIPVGWKDGEGVV